MLWTSFKEQNESVVIMDPVNNRGESKVTKSCTLRHLREKKSSIASSEKGELVNWMGKWQKEWVDK
ncbi:hypothetical protein QUF94_27265 [Peribacillus sp. NJ4]|uniref:hypothetical protein n=1 Tax=Peribacillus sp. NJ4 TaxID=3055862 RepID=UPI0025A22DCD|nr:hypothetical protein [Peribacillus sp. NJ4]MDM5215028.1 hypothetical protein [Peribacillus sp. NJ4]